MRHAEDAPRTPRPPDASGCQWIPRAIVLLCFSVYSQHGDYIRISSMKNYMRAVCALLWEVETVPKGMELGLLLCCCSSGDIEISLHYWRTSADS